ncbi:phosphonate C-P lyase system protein PhnH [Falsirhodobacter sp. 20TX0035]|uniref:phosphonate C-P lyase system protein PhnH n=1 Tax=Falsirhodobacter sp. 20TX0035 TaxID=3022019 RepID=UPI00232F23E1|nr:phosphonate C-P lyase system protein PhnH [Falsirhodobacter sp. 20TX0035]MDB6452722.1 phosphonate C-P lyase system protein PhnH [Falsirhodobacter sp. 20TX0035]
MDDIFAGGFTDAPRQSADAFRAALEAMARPGTRHALQAQAPAPLSPAAAALILTLTDTGTPLHLAGAHDTDAVRRWIGFHTGAPICPAAEAQFAIGTWDALHPLDRFAMGDAEYPDRSATLIVEMAFGRPTHRLTGPGIDGHLDAHIPGDRPVAFPLGLDLFLTSGGEMSALPRTTRLEAL